MWLWIQLLCEYQYLQAHTKDELIHNLKKDVEGLQKQQKDTVSKVYHYIQTAYDCHQCYQAVFYYIIVHLIIPMKAKS